MNIRRAVIEDCDRLSVLSFRSKAFWGYNEHFMEACRRDLTVLPSYVSSSPVYVLEEKGQVIGFYGFDIGEKNIELKDFFIEPSVIGKGYGKLLWEHMMMIAKSMRIDRFFIHSDPHAEKFYEKMGAEKIGELSSSVIPDRKLPLMQFTNVNQ